MRSIKWEHAGVLVENDRIKNWESAEVFGITQKVKAGDPWPEVLKMIGDEGGNCALLKPSVRKLAFGLNGNGKVIHNFLAFLRLSRLG